MKTLFNRFIKDESGATAIEYGLIAAIVAVGLITVLQLLGTELADTFNAVQTELNSASSTNDRRSGGS